MNDDERAEKMIADGSAINAEMWLSEKPDYRRIGESVFTDKPALNSLLAGRTSIIGEWVTDIKKDENGKEFASTVIYELPKRGRKGIFIGLKMRSALGELPIIEDIGQKYVICPMPSTKQVELAQQKIKKM